MSTVRPERPTFPDASAYPFEPRQHAPGARGRRAAPGTTAAVRAGALAGILALALSGCASSAANGEQTGGGEASLVLPDLSSVTVLGGGSGRTLLLLGLVVCAFGIGFGVASYSQLRRLPVHGSMREISELIYSTCKTYLVQQGRFLLLLWVFIGSVIVV